MGNGGRYNPLAGGTEPAQGRSQSDSPQEQKRKDNFKCCHDRSTLNRS